MRGHTRGGVILRADADVGIGTGHVMRCLAVAEELVARGQRVDLIAACLPQTLECRAAEIGVVVHRIDSWPGSLDDLAATLSLAGSLGADAAIVDGYGFGADWREGLRSSGYVVLAFDDLANTEQLHADIVVNAAPQAHTLPYDRIAPGAELLLGPSFAPLRREIREAAAAPRTPLAERESILLSFGGSDPLGLTLPCLWRLARELPSVRLDVVVGGAYGGVADLRAAAQEWGERASLHIDTRRMGALMARAGLAVSAAGTTTGELAALAVPTLLVVVADNQAPAAAAADRHGWMEVVDGRQPGAHSIAAVAARLWEDVARRTAMMRAAEGLLDALGTVRIADTLDRRRRVLTAP